MCPIVPKADGLHYGSPAGVTSGAYLVANNHGLKAIPVDRRRHRDRETRLLGHCARVAGGS